jgi:truncated hemoglobin YjbI
MSQSLDADSLLERFDISLEDLVLLKRCGESFSLSGKIQSVIDQFYEWLGEQPEFAIFFNSQETVERVKKLQKSYWEEFFSGVVDQKYIDYRVRIGEIHAQRDMPNLIRHG